MSYLIKQSMPAVSSITSESIEEFKKTDKVVIVAYFEADDKKSNTTYSEAAEELRNDFVFGATNDAALAKAEGIKTPGIILYKDFDEGKSLYTETFAKEEIEKFIRSASIPLIGEIGPDTYAGYMAAQIPLAYIFASTPEERKSFAEELKDIATKHKGAVNFATIDAKQFGAHAANLNLEADKFPAFAIQETVKNQKFPFSQDEKITAASIGKFVDDFVAGKVKPSIKSEATPEKQEGPVYMIVANNYEEIVMNDEADVLVEYYAPWCGHCKALAPKYEELGALYFNKPDFAKKVIIAKVDATLNDVPEEISGFPTIKLFPAGSKSSPLDYSGARTVEGLAEFVKEKGKWQVDGLAGAGKQEDAILPDAEEMGKVPPAASKKAQEAMDTAKDATDKAKATAGSAAEKASDAASSVTEAAGSAASDASEAAATAKESVKGAAQKVAEGVVGGAQAVKEAIKTMAGDGDGDVESSDEL